ncbi:MAG: putative transcriptional regulator [Candidatus Bathyarchaeota archaeon B63]|nr:MAG: putative transcriptional regulator [Candidatus Bathyarchaeota archaeon B63]
MTRKRSHIEIYLDVLKAVKSGTHKPTNIMYKCNLAWKPFKQILDSLVDNELLEINRIGKRRTYQLTQKGNEALRYFEAARSLLVALRSNNQK